MKAMSAALFVLLLVSFAQAQQSWARTYGGVNSDEGYSVQQTSDGGYVVMGYTNSFGAGGYDVYLVKTNASGDTLWTKVYGGTQDDAGNSVQQTSDGGYIIAGYTQSFGAGDHDVWLLKTNASGDTLWTRTYGGRLIDEGNSVQQTSDSGYVIAGHTGSFGAGYDDVYLIKTNAAGDTLWTRTFGGPVYDFGNSVRQTSDGGYIMTGYTWAMAQSNYDVWLIKTNAAGDTLWTRTYGGMFNDRGNSVRQTLDGGYVIVGYSNSFADSNDVYLIKTDSSGDTLWTRTYGGYKEEVGNSVQQTMDGGYIIAGGTWSFGAGADDAWLIKTNVSGDTLWTSTYGGAYADYGYSVQQTSDSCYIVAGFTASFGVGLEDVYIIKTDKTGNVGVEEPKSGRQVATGSVRATPNPFTSFATIPGHEGERFSVYDISGKMVGAYRGNRIGEGLAPAVYFIKPEDEHGMSLRVVKVR